MADVAWYLSLNKLEVNNTPYGLYSRWVTHTNLHIVQLFMAQVSYTNSILCLWTRYYHLSLLGVQTLNQIKSVRFSSSTIKVTQNKQGILDKKILNFSLYCYNNNNNNNNQRFIVILCPLFSPKILDSNCLLPKNRWPHSLKIISLQTKPPWMLLSNWHLGTSHHVAEFLSCPGLPHLDHFVSLREFFLSGT